MRKKVLIGLMVLMVATYVVLSVNSIMNQENTIYICKNDVMALLKNDPEYFEQLANFYENYESYVATYDLSKQLLILAEPDYIETTILEKLFSEYSFNLVDKYGNSLYIAYNRPHGHNVIIGLSYDYDSKKWNYTYNHNYEMCEFGHLNGYKIFDWLFN